MDGLLTFEHGIVTLGDIRLPGILKDQAVRCGVRFDEAKQDGMSGKAKTPIGWEDAAVTLTMELTTEETDTCYDKLERINVIFKSHDTGANPKIYQIANPHVTARGIEQVVFAGLNSVETDSDDIIKASLAFTEHKPTATLAEKRVVASDKAVKDGGTDAPKTADGSPDPDKEIMNIGLR